MTWFGQVWPPFGKYDVTCEMTSHLPKSSPKLTKPAKSQPSKDPGKVVFFVLL